MSDVLTEEQIAALLTTNNTTEMWALIASHTALTAALARCVEALEGSKARWERVGVLGLKLGEWADNLNNSALLDIASELGIAGQLGTIIATAALTSPEVAALATKGGA